MGGQDRVAAARAGRAIIALVLLCVLALIAGCDGGDSSTAVQSPGPAKTGVDRDRLSTASRGADRVETETETDQVSTSLTFTLSASQDRDRARLLGEWRRLRDEKLVRSELLARGVTVSEDEVEAAWNTFAALLDPETLARVVSSGPPEEERRSRLRARLEIERLVADDLTSPIGEEEIRAFYERNRWRYVAPEAFVARELVLVARDAEARAARLAELHVLEEALEAGASFALLARRHSEAPTAQRGGETGRLTQDRVSAALWSALEGLPSGEHGTVETSDGLYLIQLIVRIPARFVTIDEARQEIVENLRASRRSEATARILAELRNRPQALETDPLGAVNGSQLSLDAFNRRLAAGSPRSPIGMEGADEFRILQLKLKIVDELIDEALVQQAADQRGLHVSKSELEVAMADLETSFPSRGAFENFVRQWPGGLEGVRQERRLSILASRLQESADVRVTESEIRASFEAHEARYRHPAHLLADKIVIEFDPSASEQEIDGREALIRELAEAAESENKSFRFLARRASDASNARHGGDMGSVTETSVSPEIWAALEGMAPGEISPVITFADRFVLLRLRNRIPERALQLDDVREEILQHLQERRWASRKAALLTRLREEAHIVNHLEQRYQAEFGNVSPTTVRGGFYEDVLDSLPENVKAGNVGSTSGNSR